MLGILSFCRGALERCHHIITEYITKRRANRGRPEAQIRSQNPKRQISNRTLLLLITTVTPIVKGSTTNWDLEASSQEDTCLSTAQTMAIMGAIILAIWYLTCPGTAHLTPWSGRNMNPRKPQASARLLNNTHAVFYHRICSSLFLCCSRPKAILIVIIE